LANLIGMPSLGPMTLLTGEVGTTTFVTAAAYIIALLTIALLMPNSLQVMSKYGPALDTPQRPPELVTGWPVYWRPTLLWMVFTAVLAALSVMRVIGKSEFLYWQF
jgi:hypothetical protein